MDMYPELTDAEVEALNKLVHDVEKFNKRLQRMEESERIQAASMEEKFDRINDLLEKMMPTPKSESEPHTVCFDVFSQTPSPDPELCVSVETDMISKGTIEVDEDSSTPEWESKADGLYLTPVKVDRSNDDDQVSSDLFLSSDSFLIEDAPKPKQTPYLILELQKEVISEYFTINYSSTLLDDKVVMEPDETHELKLTFFSNLNLFLCSPSVCQYVYMDWTPFLAMRGNSVCNQGYLLLQKKKVRFGKPPAKPPDDVVLRDVSCCEPNNVWHPLSSHLMSCGCHIWYCSKYWDLGLPLIQRQESLVWTTIRICASIVMMEVEDYPDSYHICCLSCSFISLWLSVSRYTRCFSWFYKWMLVDDVGSVHILLCKDSEKGVPVREQAAKFFKEKLILVCVERESELVGNPVSEYFGVTDKCAMDLVMLLFHSLQSSYFNMHTASISDVGYILPPFMKLRFLKPPTKPPDGVLISKTRIDKTCQAAEKLFNNGYTSESDALLKRKFIGSITAGSQALDELLEGDIETRAIIGPFGKLRFGKVQPTLCESIQLPTSIHEGLTIESAAIAIFWNNISMNIVYTPGQVDLTIEIEQALRDLDCICLFDSVAGSETVRKHAYKYGVPRLCLVNKIDHHGAAFFRTRDMTVTKLGAKPMAVLQRPIGVNDFFRGMVDLVKMKTIVCSVADSSYQNISMDLQESVKECRALAIETIVQLDDVVMENYLEGGELEDEPAELAFKIMSVSLIGSLTFVRVYAGALTVGTYMLNFNKEKERKGHLLVMHANSRDNFKLPLTCDKVALGLDGVDDTVGGIVEASMSMKFAKKFHPYLITKNTILKRCGGRLKYILHDVYKQNWKQKVEEESRGASGELLGAAHLPKPMPFFEAVSMNLNETTSLQTAIAVAKLKYAHKFYKRSKEADFAFLVRSVISFSMFSVPRPPEVAELDREINLEAKEVHIMSFGQAPVKNKVLHILRNETNLLSNAQKLQTLRTRFSEGWRNVAYWELKGMVVFWYNLFSIKGM